MKKYGSKDIMRMESIEEKAHGDFLERMMYAYNMACAITDPGKAMARGYAAQEVFGEHSPVAATFFERAHQLGGTNVRPMASVSWTNSEEGIETELSDIPEEEQPASRRTEKKILDSDDLIIRKNTWSEIMALGRMNLIKGSGPEFNLYNYPAGTIEVWEENDKYKMIYTSNREPNFYINETRSFKYEGNNKKWKLIDYIESEFVSNLAPLYGKNLPIFMYC